MARPPVASEETNKRRVREDLRVKLEQFLASGDRLAFPISELIDVSVIIALFNQAHFTLHTLRGVLSQTGVNLEVILVDNNSTDETSELLSRLDNVRVLRNQDNLGFLTAVNQGAAEATGRTILLLNSDAFLRKNTLAIALRTLDSDADIGAVGGRLILPSSKLQEAGNIVWSDANVLGYGRGMPPEAGEAMFRRDVDYCSGAFLLTPRAIFERMGGLDPVYAPAYYEEVDYCLRLWQAGLRVVYEPDAVIDHYEFGSETRKSNSMELYLRNLKRIRSRHITALQLEHSAPGGNVLFAREHARQRQRLLVIDKQEPFGSLNKQNLRTQLLLNEAVTAGWFVTLYLIVSRELAQLRRFGA
jgi:GT2 family glycosyltransferase